MCLNTGLQLVVLLEEVVGSLEIGPQLEQVGD